MTIEMIEPPPSEVDTVVRAKYLTCAFLRADDGDARLHIIGSNFSAAAFFNAEASRELGNALLMAADALED